MQQEALNGAQRWAELHLRSQLKHFSYMKRASKWNLQDILAQKSKRELGSWMSSTTAYEFEELRAYRLTQKAYNMHLDIRRCKNSTEVFNLPVALDLMKHKEQQDISSCIHSHEWVNTKHVSQKWQCFGKWRIFDWLHTVTFPQMRAKVPLNSRFPEGLWTCNILFSPFKWHE